MGEISEKCPPLKKRHIPKTQIHPTMIAGILVSGSFTKTNSITALPILIVKMNPVTKQITKLAINNSEVVLILYFSSPYKTKTLLSTGVFLFKV